jgi:hypothetical protein
MPESYRQNKGDPRRRVGCVLPATSPRYDIRAVLEQFLSEADGTQECHVVGSSLRTSYPTVALVN